MNELLWHRISILFLPKRGPMLISRLLLSGSTCIAVLLSFHGASVLAGDGSPSKAAMSPSSACSPTEPLTKVTGEEFAELVGSGLRDWVGVEVSQPSDADLGGVDLLTEVPPAVTLLPCGGSAVGSGRFSYPPLCGNSPSEAAATAMQAVLGKIAKGYTCETCPLPGQCRLSVFTLPDGWTVPQPRYVSPDSDNQWILCPGQWTTSADYNGPYIVACGGCGE